MAQQWIVKRPQAASAPVPPPTQVLPVAILGTPVLTTAYATDQNHQLLIDVTIPISWPSNNWGDVDRLITHLLAPDNYVDTQEAFVGGPGAGGSTAGQETPGIVIGDAANASKVVDLDSTGIMIETPWDKDRPFVHFTQPAPTEPEWWRAIVVSASKTATNKVDGSPSVRFHVLPTGADVLGLEFAPLGLNFHLIHPVTGAVTDQPYYDTAEGGVPVWGFSCTWENDVKDPRYPVLGGYDIEIEYPDGKKETHASKSSNDRRHDSPMWTFGAPGNFRVWLISWSSQAGNPRNTPVLGLTPSVAFYVSAPTGPVGSEHAANVTGFQLVNPYYGKNGQGQKTLYLPFQWVKPDDRNYQGGIIVMIRGDGTHYPLTGLETDASQVCELQQFPATGATEAVTFYFKSVSTSGDVNTYKAGYPGDPAATPAIALSLNGPADTTPQVAAFTATINYGRDEFNIPTYNYSGTWANPNKALFPEYQGVKIVRANADGTGRIDLTGIEAGTSFNTSYWPVQVANSIYIYAISVDVNGVERAITSSPRLGPFFITAQGGVMNNENLPDIDVANFAAGVEPLTFVNAPPDANGWLIVPKQTTEVFNQNDQRLYRWDTNIGRYRVVGSALDIVASTITGGLIKAGAITSLHMAAQEILVGPLPIGGTGADARPPIFKVENPSRQMVGFFGTYQGWEGLYALNLRVGKSFTTPMLEASNLGLALRGTVADPIGFELTDANQSYVKMSPITLDATYQSIGVLVSSPSPANASQTYHVSRGIIAYENSIKYLALARNPNWAAGELVIYGPNDPNTIRVLITGVDTGTGLGKGVVRADRFDCGGSPGITTAGLVSVTKISVVGGLVVGIQ